MSKRHYIMVDAHGSSLGTFDNLADARDALRRLADVLTEAPDPYLGIDDLAILKFGRRGERDWSFAPLTVRELADRHDE